MNQPGQRSGTVIFLITDLVGSTELLEQVGDEEGISITTGLMARLMEVATQHRGEAINNMGDGWIIAFSSALDAIACAVSMQHAVSFDESNPDPRRRLPVRIGIHAGEPIHVDGAYLGLPINVATRVCNAATSGQIVVSNVVRELVDSRGGFTFHDLGVRAMKGLQSPVRLWEVVWKLAETAEDTERQPAAEASRGPQARRADREPDTVVILYADIVDSVPQTERWGDAGFRERSRELDALLRAHVGKHRGATVDGKLVGDGVMAIFPSARSAIACALKCGGISASVELELHVGIHAGDVIRDGANIYGGAVNIAARISAATKAGEILLSDTVRGLARTSGGVSFEDCGEYVLKGIDEPMRLFTVRA